MKEKAIQEYCFWLEETSRAEIRGASPSQEVDFFFFFFASVWNINAYYDWIHVQ